ncbi:hypothetical protein BGZ54_002650 [Gamsiella multidivaricata]|nr:hypothetical protein BGZ54_002650 [Gamsiella multidivaricata]
MGKRARASSFLRSSLSPLGFGYQSDNRTFMRLKAEEEPPLVHCPLSVASLDQFSPERHAWVRECLSGGRGMPLTTTASAQLSNVLKSERAWEAMEGHYGQQSSEELVAPGLNFAKTGYNNLNEATGLVLVKLMQVTNRASSKIYDIECNIRVGDVERMSHPTRSFKDSPGNTATMNEVFLFDVDKPFQIELDVIGTPVTTKFGTIAGFSNTDTVHLGRVILSLPLETMEQSVRTYKLQRLGSLEDVQPSAYKIQSKDKTDCEIVIMMGVHVLEEPVEDHAWETEVLYQGNLTVMTRGPRMSSWKRYWAVLDGCAIKLYDAEYQLKRNSIAAIPLAYILGVQPPDYDKINVGSNGFSIEISPTGIDVSNASGFDPADMDNILYAFTDSAYQHDGWTARIEEALDQYRENMVKRGEVKQARKSRKGRSMGPGAALEREEEGWEPEERQELIDLRFVS